jgi:hypothetical protein
MPPLFALHTYKTGVSVLESVNINGVTTLPGSSVTDFTVIGQFSSGSSADLNAYVTSWQVIQGALFASINSSGHFTAFDVNSHRDVIIQANVTYETLNFSDVHTVQVTAPTDSDINNVSLLINGDLIPTLLSNSVDNPGIMYTSSNVQMNASGTFNTSVTVNVNEFTTWDITVGGSYASINSSTGVLTIGSNPFSNAVTVRATTTYEGVTMINTRTLTAYVFGSDTDFDKVSILIAAD